MAARHPRRLALRADGDELTYEELDLISNRIAHALLERCGPGSEPVALVMDTDPEMLTAMWGVLKSGKFYIPLDAGLPPQRLGFILNNAGCGIVLSCARQAKISAGLADSGRRFLELESLSAGFPDNPPDVTPAPDSPACLLYTSGSTGVPKGVLQTHRNVLHMTLRYTDTIHITCDDRHTLLSNATFAGAMVDIFGTLLNGASLLIYNVRADGIEQLADWLERERVTIYHSVPTLFRHLMRLPRRAERLENLRIVKLGGEPVFRSDWELFCRRFPRGCLFMNIYGSTEILQVCRYFLNHDSRPDAEIIPVGFPNPGVSLAIIDRNGREAAPGEAGEIVVRSRYITPGYWNDDALTRAVIKSAPDGSDERLLHTGDLGRQNQDGSFVHLGRSDNQVKIRGFRVELTEVESHLAAHPDVGDALVVKRENRDGESHLIAYFTPAGKTTPTDVQLRRFLADRIPDFMLPTLFAPVGTLPYTTSNKLDRNAALNPLLWRVAWQEAPDSPTTRGCPHPPGKDFRLPGATLIFSDGKFSDRIIAKLRQQGARFTEVREGGEYRQLSEELYTLPPDDPAAYRLLLQQLRARDRLPQYIIHLWSLNNPHFDPDASLDLPAARSFYGLVWLVQALGNFPGRRFRVAVATRDRFKIQAADRVNPVMALAAGPVIVASQEHPNLSLRGIDFAADTDPDRAAGCLIGCHNCHATTVWSAWRNNCCWTPRMETQLQAVAPDEPPLPDGSVCLVTGGLGGMGLAMAEWLARRGRCKLALLNRSPLPPEPKWEEILARLDSPERGAPARLRKLKAVRQSAQELLLLQADVTEPDSLSSALNEIRRRLGRINAVIHAAGVPPAGSIALKQKDAAAGVLSAKVNGAILLDRLLEKDNPELFILCSSVTAHIGGPGEVDYTSANAFLDAFAHERWQRRGKPTVSINWDTWQEVGMAAEAFAAGRVKNWSAGRMADALKTEQALEALHAILRNPEPQIGVSMRPIDVSQTYPDFSEESEHHKEADNSVANFLIDVWKELLQVDRVTLEADFFQLGGHSLIATRYLTRVYERFGVELEYQELFTAPTLVEQAALIETAAKKGRG